MRSGDGPARRRPLGAVLALLVVGGYTVYSLIGILRHFPSYESLGGLRVVTDWNTLGEAAACWPADPDFAAQLPELPLGTMSPRRGEPATACPSSWHGPVELEQWDGRRAVWLPGEALVLTEPGP